MNEQFLVSPELFPARMAGEVWGSESATIELAGELYRIEGLSPSQLSSLQERYGPRMVDPSSALRPPSPRTRGEGLKTAITVSIFRAPRTDFREIDTRGWEYVLDIAWSEQGVAMVGLRLMARADFSSSRAALWTCVEEEAEFSGVLENVLRPLLAAHLLAHGGLLVHSASVDGWLFPSRSGGGKSTIARMGLSAGLPVLSDDLNVVVSGNTILPLPFTGDLDENELSTIATPLRAIVALEKGDHESLRRMPLADAVALLVRCAPYVNQDAHRVPLLLERAAQIASATARGVLTFRRGGEVWPILQALP